MELLKPLNISTEKLSPNQPFTSVEMAKLWATYMGNSMSRRILQFYLQHVTDNDIKLLLENGLSLAEDFISRIEYFFKKEHFPIPIGFTEDDVNLGAPRLFEDEFYVHYLKYAAKAGLSLYAVAIPLVMRTDIRDFFIHCNTYTMNFLAQINTMLMEKGLIIKPPVIPIPEKVDFLKKQNYLTGFFSDVRELHALEITHLYDNVENNITSKALLIGFSQVAKEEKVRDFLVRGKEITTNEVDIFQEKLHKDHLPAPSLLDHLVTSSTFSPFSDKIMTFHKVDMFSVKIRSFGNSLAISARKDLGLMYAKCIEQVSFYVNNGANILIENGWMEQPPKAADRDQLITKKH